MTRQSARDTPYPAAGAPTDAWAFALPAGWARFPTEAGVVYLPTVPVAEISVPASITEVEIFGEAGRSPFEVAAGLLNDVHEESRPVELDGRPGVRAAGTLHETPGGTTRQVVYVVSRDDVDGDWLVLSFSTTFSTSASHSKGGSPGRSSAPAELADVLVEFFDAVMTTFRWTGPGADPVNLPERTVPGSV